MQASQPFAIQPLPPTERADFLWQKAQAADDPAKRHELLAGVLAFAPDHADARAALTQLDNEAEAAHLYAAALAYYEKAQWPEARRAFEQVEKMVPNYQETRTHLAHVLGQLSTPQPGTQPGSQTPEGSQYRPILNALMEGRLTPFLGGEVSRIGQPTQDSWVAGLYPPGATDAASQLDSYLPIEFQGTGSLLQASQYTMLIDGEFALYDRLTTLYDQDFAPTVLHRLLAEVPARLAAKGKAMRRRYILFSTALDDLLERAFDDVGQPYHLFAYRPRFVDDDAVTQYELFLHIPPAAGRDTEQPPATEILEPNRYADHGSDDHPIIVKLCGRRVTPAPDSVAVTEDQYMNYISAERSKAVLPTTLLNQIKRNNFLFFGHSLQPWHLRLLWQRLGLSNSQRQPPKWAIVPSLTTIEEKFWQSQRIDPIVAQAEGVVAYVNDWLDKL